MSEVPDVGISVGQGGQPVLNSGLLRTHVVIGAASSGTYACREVNLGSLVSTYTSGDTVKSAARTIGRVSANALFVRRNHTAVAATKTTTSTIAGTALATISGTPDEAREYVFTVTTGDTVVGGIDYSLSLDGGETETTGTIASTGILSLGGGLTLTLDPPANALVALANDIRAQCLVHFPKTAGGVHGAADNASDDGFAAVATSNATALTLANTLRTGILAHFALGATTHTAADTTNGTGIPAAATTLQEARLLLIALKTALNAHEVDLAYHGLADTALVTEASPSSGTLSTGDEILVSTTDPSPAILSLAKSGGGTLTVTASGTPLETVRGRVEFLNEGEVGVDGGRYRVSLDNGKTWQPTASLGTATSITILDRRVDETTTTTGVTLNLTATETFDATTVITFRTTGPQVAIADVLAAIDVAAASSFKSRGWRLFHIVGNYTAAEMDQVQTKLASLQSSKIWNYAVMQFRDKREHEPEADWIADIVADRATVNLNRVNACAGYGRNFTCPLTNRLDRRPAAWLDTVRRLCVDINVESGRFKDGPLGSEVNGKVGGEGSSGDVTLYEDGERVEHDADEDATLANARITVLRTFKNGGVGTYINGSRMATGPASKFTRTRDRELMDEAARALANEGFRQLLNNVRRNPGNYSAPAQPGDPGTILEADALEIELQAKSAIKARIGSKANSITMRVGRNDDLTGNNGPRIITEVAEVEGQPVIEQIDVNLNFLG